MSGPHAPLLAPLAWIYGLAVRRRNRRFDRGIGVERVAVPVVSVGNVVVGGTGKTPFVAWLAARLGEIGARPAIVSRGYGGRRARGPLVVSEGAGPRVEADLAGDEPVELARRLPDLPIVVGADRVAAARRAVELGADLLLLDDGFQHRRLHRDLDIVLVDAAAPFGNGRLLPAGPLREPACALARAGALIATRWHPGVEPRELRSRLAALAPQALLALARHRVAGFHDAAGRPIAAPASALAFSGVARPESVREALAAGGVAPIGFETFPDHHRFDAEELARLDRRAREARVPLMTTEKDLARIGRAAHGLASPLATLRIEIVLDDPGPLLSRLQRLVGRMPA